MIIFKINLKSEGKMKILFVTTIADTMKFFSEHIKMLIKEGHKVELATNCDEDIPLYCFELNLKMHNIPFSRSPFSRKNIEAFRDIKKIIKSNKYDIIHTHTPNSSACVRLACRKQREKGLKVFYTAHGFHFYKGVSIKNWLVYYPIEYLCSFWTDKLITINQEDFLFAQKHMHAKKIEYVPGVGVDLRKFGQSSVSKDDKRNELGIPLNAIVLLSVGELNINKNHETVIKAINGMNVYYIIVGQGKRKEYLESLINKQGMSDRIKLLGYRSDISELLVAADLFVFPSYREGLSVSLMEAMASGLPCCVSKIRGNIDLIDKKGGNMFNPKNVKECKNAILALLESKIGAYNKEKVKQFSVERVLSFMDRIYNT